MPDFAGNFEKDKAMKTEGGWTETETTVTKYFFTLKNPQVQSLIETQSKPLKKLTPQPSMLS